MNREKVVQATQLESGGMRHLGEIIMGIILLIIGTVVALVALYIVSLLFTERPESILGWIGLLLRTLLFIITSLFAVVCIYLGVIQVKIITDWKFTLYTNEIVAQIKEDITENKLTSYQISIEDITRCIVMRKERRSFLVIDKKFYYEFIYLIGIHLYYEEAGVEKLLSFEDPNNLEDLDKAIYYLQNECHIPVCFTDAVDHVDTRYENQEIIALFPPEPITFTGSLKQYKKRRKVIRTRLYDKENKHDTK